MNALLRAASTSRIPHRSTLPRGAALLATLGLLCASCHRGGEATPQGPTVPCRETWPVLLLSAADPGAALAPIEAFAATWLRGPSRSDAPPWTDPREVESLFAGGGASPAIGRARALLQLAGAFDALSLLDAEALCALARHPSAYGSALPEGHLIGAEACLWAGEADGAAAAWDLASSAARDAHRSLAWTWPTLPEVAPPPAELARRELPIHGWSGGGDGTAPVTALPTAAHRDVHRSHGQTVEYAFVLPGDLWSAARAFEARAANVIAACAGCPEDLADWLDGRAAPGGPACSTPPGAALPLTVGTGWMLPSHACAAAGASGAPPRYTGADDTDIGALDEAAEAYLTAYARSVRGGPVADGTLADEAMPTVREMSRRAVYRRLGIEAMSAGDNAAALWALEIAAGADWSTTARGANDPEMVCLLALARYRAGRMRSVIEVLDDAGEERGWEILADIARTVARVEALPGDESVGVMR